MKMCLWQVLPSASQTASVMGISVGLLLLQVWHSFCRIQAPASRLFKVPGGKTADAQSTTSTFRDSHPRIVVLGMSASGKSTLCQLMSARFHIPHIELDALHHLPGWRVRDTESFRELVLRALDDAEAVRSSKTAGWIVDGNYSSVRDLVWPRATTIVWLDYPAVVNWFFLLMRTASRCWYGTACCGGNVEQWWRHLQWNEQSMFFWMWKQHAVLHQQLRSVLSSDEHTDGQGRTVNIRGVRVVRLRSPGDTKQWLTAALGSRELHHRFPL